MLIRSRGSGHLQVSFNDLLKVVFTINNLNILLYKSFELNLKLFLEFETNNEIMNDTLIEYNIVPSKKNSRDDSLIYQNYKFQNLKNLLKSFKMIDTENRN